VKVVFAFLLGSLLTGVSTYFFMHKSHENYIELAHYFNYAVDLNTSALLMSKEDSQVKCTIAMLAVSNAKTLNNISIKDHYIYHAPGMPYFTRKTISESLAKFDKQEIEKYDDICKSKNT
jgi:hypothetical protein